MTFPEQRQGFNPTPRSDDSRGAIRAELKTFQMMFTDKAIKAVDTVTKTHLEDLRDQITMILEPKK
ncbi:MAG: hypothetical protein NTV82_19155 [Candidatus Aminicenantes bacterium]|nr:hypothetical protein [Candidatus Aminicenantes bacterium]